MLRFTQKGLTIACQEVNTQPFFIGQTVESKAKVPCCKYCSVYEIDQTHRRCVFGCKEIYCSEECSHLDNSLCGHWLYCTGKSKDRNATRLISTFLTHSKTNNAQYGAALEVIAKLLSSVISDRNNTLSSSFSRQLATFFSTFPVSDASVDSSNACDNTATAAEEDSLEESHFMLTALLKFGPRPPPPEDLLGAPVGEEEYVECVGAITLDVYRKIVAVLSTHLVAVKMEQPLHPTITAVKNIPLLPTYKQRKQAVETYNREAKQATAFLVPTNNAVSLDPTGELMQSQQQLGDAGNSKWTDIIQAERLAARLSQAADIASTNSSDDCNPFSGICFVAMMLIPAVVVAAPWEQPSSSRISLAHSCMPNVHVEAFLEPVTAAAEGGKCPLRVRAVALRDIYPQDRRTHCFVECGAGGSRTERQAQLKEKLTAVYGGNVVDAHFSGDTVCDCGKCCYESSPARYLEDLLTLSHAHNEDDQSSSLQQRVEQYRAQLRSVVIQCETATVSPSTQLRSPTAQYLLSRVLELHTAATTTATDTASQPSCGANPLDRLLSARNLADAFMQEGRVGDAMSLYCGVILEYISSLSNNAGGDGQESAEQLATHATADVAMLVKVVGDVFLSVGNALLDIAIAAAISSAGPSPSVSPPADSSAPISLASPLQWLTESPWQLCHRVWRVGHRVLSGAHATLREHVAKLDSYTYIDGSVACDASSLPIAGQAFSAADYHIVFIPRPSSESSAGRTRPPSTASPAPSIYLSKEPVLTAGECDHAIQLAEAHAARTQGGWTTTRHYAVPTIDIPINAVPDLLAWFNAIMRDKLVPMLRGQFCDEDEESGGEPSPATGAATRAAKQRYLPLHSDQSTHSLTVALNGRGEYVGGGTYFGALDTALRPDKGHVLSFRGELLHGGDPIVSGTRYILAIFLLLQTEKPSVTVRTADDIGSSDGDWSGRKRKADVAGIGGLASLFKDRTAATAAASCTTAAAQSETGETTSTGGLFSFAFDDTEEAADQEAHTTGDVSSAFSFGFDP